MRMTLRQLRRLIREAPLVDILPPTQIKAEHPPSWHELRGPAPDKKRVQRFYSTPKFRDSTVKLYKNLTIPIFVIPAWSTYEDDYTRSEYYTGEDAQKLLSIHCQLSPEKVDELMNAMNRGAAVLLSIANKLVVDFLPTPWMIVHAYYDNNVGGGRFESNTMETMYDMVNDYYGDRFSSDKKFIELIEKSLTFKSARENNINSVSDLCAEICTQEVLTTNGFVYNETGDEELDRLLTKIKQLVTGERQNFENAIAGKLTKINVYAP